MRRALPGGHEGSPVFHGDGVGCLPVSSPRTSRRRNRGAVIVATRAVPGFRSSIGACSAPSTVSRTRGAAAAASSSAPAPASTCAARKPSTGLIEKNKASGGFGLSLVGGVLAEVKDKDLEQLASLPDVEGISVDAPVKAHQSATDPCSTWVTGYGTACGDPASQFSVDARRDGLPQHELGRLGRRRRGDRFRRGASDDLRITASYDFRTGVAVQVSPYDGYGHGTHVAGLIASSGSHSKGYYQGVAPGAPHHRAARARQQRRRLHQQRHQGGRVRGGQPHQPGHPRHQPVARPPDLRAGGERPAGAGGRIRGPRRHRGRGLGGQQRAGRRTAWSATPASRRPATRRRRSPSARSITRTRRVAARRHGGAVQLARPDLVRRLRQARHPRAGPPCRRAGPVDREAVSAAPIAARLAAVGVVIADDAPPAVGHEHVDRGGLRA